MKRLIAITVLFGTVPAHATCNPHRLAAVAKMCRLEALSGASPRSNRWSGIFATPRAKIPDRFRRVAFHIPLPVVDFPNARLVARLARL
jgi:hypothetical protein